MEDFKFTREMVLADMEYSDRLFPNDYSVSKWSEDLILRGYSTKASSLFFFPVYRLLEGLRERALLRKYGEQFPQGLPNINGLFYIMEPGIDWCIEQLGKLPQPFLAYIHFYPPHHPYYTRRDFIDRFKDDYVPTHKPRHRFSEKGTTQKFLNQQRKAYDEYLAYADSEFGRLYDHLLQSGLLDKTCLIFTSDHGEMFERGIWGHGTRTLYEPIVRVPLLVSRPGQAERQEIHTPTSNVDLLPTLLHLMGQPIPEWCEGQILPTFAEPPANSERSIYVMEAKQNAQRAPLKIGTFALVKWPYKLIHYRGYEDYKGERDELYNLADDPEELDNRHEAENSVAREMEQELDEKLAEKNRPFERH
jgi:arylsulfatase A-like enzyme